ncbi:MAG: ASCH domain-containing protein [Anaerolineales bacterium]
MSESAGISPTESIWQAYQSSLPSGHPHRLASMPAAWSFGNSPEMADTLGSLVLQRVKNATCSMLWGYESDGEPLPQLGELSIILDGDDNPLCIIETVEVEVKPMNDVDEKFAYEEGEGDRSLTYWRETHWRYFSKICKQKKISPAENMPLVCERFRVVYPG